jgi:hypothetical protein
LVVGHSAEIQERNTIMLKPFTEKLIQIALVLHIGGVALVGVSYVAMAFALVG